MRYVTIIWDSDDDENGNVHHIAEHLLTPQDIESVVENSTAEAYSRSSGRPCLFGYTPSGDHIIVIYDEVDADTMYPVTAYEVPERL